MRKNPPKKKKKRPVRTAVLMTLAMMAIFAITFTIFFHLLGGSFVSEEESTQTPEATLPAAVTEEATEKAEEKATEKPSVVEKVKEKAESAINSVTEKHTEAPAETETPAAAEEETAGHAEDSDYLFESARYVIRQAELESRSRQEIKLIYYEIYARHGYDFQDTELKEYFSGKTWYNPVTSHREEAEAGFNVVERENIEVIERYQTEQGWR